MNKWEHREGKLLRRRSKFKFKLSEDEYESYQAKANAKKIAKRKRRWAQEVKDIIEIDDQVD